MLALHAMEGFLSGLSSVRLGSGACEFVGRELQDCVDSFCPCGPDAVLVALGCVVVPLYLMDSPPFGVYAWFDSGYMHLPYLPACCSVLDFLGDDIVPLISGSHPVFGVYVWSDGGYTLTRQSRRYSDNFLVFST